MNIKEIKEISTEHTSQEIDMCIIEVSENKDCKFSDSIDDLSKASYIRKKMDEGMSQREALRDLASKIRNYV